MSELLELAERVTARARALGAEEVATTVSSGSHATLSRREGRVEKATEATTRGLVVSMLVDDRFSSSSTSDLRPEALEPFLERCVASAGYLEPDPDRKQAPGELCGRGATVEHLDQDDASWREWTPEARAAHALALEEALRARGADDVLSTSCTVADGRSEIVRVLTNGFSDSDAGAWFAAGGEMTLQEGDRRPESSAYYAARHKADLPDVDAIADEVVRRTRERLGAAAIASGRYPMVLENRSAARLLGVLAGPLSGGSIFEHRSCLADKLGERIGSPLLSIVDDPTVPRGLGSRPWDGDGLVARPRTIVEDGVLRSHNLSVYYARKLGREPTSGSRSNWVLPVGERAWQEVAADWPAAVLVTGFLGGNSNAATGDFSFGIRGVLLERGQRGQALSEMNVTGNALDIFTRLVALGDDPWPWSSTRTPTLMFEDVQFSGT